MCCASSLALFALGNGSSVLALQKGIRKIKRKMEAAVTVSLQGLDFSHTHEKGEEKRQDIATTTEVQKKTKKIKSGHRRRRSAKWWSTKLDAQTLRHPDKCTQVDTLPCTCLRIYIYTHVCACIRNQRLSTPLFSYYYVLLELLRGESREHGVCEETVRRTVAQTQRQRQTYTTTHEGVAAG